MENEVEVKVRRANVILRIRESQVDQYLSMGYSLVDDNGNVLKEATKMDADSLFRLHIQDLEKIKSLEKEVASLKEQLEVKKGRPKKTN